MTNNVALIILIINFAEEKLHDLTWSRRRAFTCPPLKGSLLESNQHYYAPKTENFFLSGKKQVSETPKRQKGTSKIHM